MCKVIAITNQKGGVGKTTTAVNLGIGLANVMSREMIMKEYVEAQREQYDYIIIDCMPSLGTMTINALVSSDLVLIPVQAAYLPVLGLQQLIRTISMVKKRLNKKLRIGGIVLTMVDKRTNYAKDIMESVRKTYEGILPVYESVIPISIKAAESSAVGISVYTHANNCKVSDAYRELTKEVLYDEEA